jgi:hypothetical protein
MQTFGNTPIRQLLFDNVRGRIRQLIWNDVIAGYDGAEGVTLFTEEDKIRYLIDTTKKKYKQYKPYFEEMDNIEEEIDNEGTAENPLPDSGSEKAKRPGRAKNGGA